MSKIPERPLEKIALSCSGGGYRAASFHLGAMSYLNRLQYNGRPLLENVKMISTVSGGTFTGVVYALHKQRKKSFEEIYHFMLDQLSKLDLVKLGIEKLNPNGKWHNTHKRKNLINAFAELYDEHFTEGETLAVFDSMNSHLEAVAFNSTEFNNAINFRFRNKNTGIIGNNFNRVPADVAGEIKLADAIAASSCFPGGFEPIMWPADFVHDKANTLKKNRDTLKPAGLMDGGIYDNQGIDSILLYKKSDQPYFDLIIISDVTSPYMDGFKPATEKPKTGWRTMTVREFGQKIMHYNRLVNRVIIALITLFALLPLLKGYTNHWLTGLSLGISLTLLACWSIKLWAFAAVRKTIRQQLENLEAWIKNKKLDFYYERLSLLKIEELSIHRIEPLLADRFNSLLSLLLNVFLKVVRRLNYKMVYENDKWQYRRISNLIHELTEEDFTKPVKQPNKPTDNNLSEEITQSTAVKKTLTGPYKAVIGDKIKIIAEEVADFGTTLWFTEKEQLDDMLGKLIATGQFTMCYNMLDYIESLMYTPGNGYDELDNTTKKTLKEIHEKCLQDWTRFKQEPLFLLKEMKENRLMP
ncbi:patatin-like phospholipase family protein [Niastella sp. OAS944]|uniref:patatin-like phospholipase family protein n=1 Tax=Niastella sp. OAS944 TaxID=2664089 RepID=UPI0035C7E32E|nr:putative acylesterase/phospholipase RssA [Chitinophagaceae bacterium OAS944]